MHMTLPVEVEEELVAVLTHACIDCMTSDLSTVPYTQEQCQAYIKLIPNMPESEKTDGYRNCVLARIWSEIDGNYFVNLHGESHARLSRIQRLLPEPSVESTPFTNGIRKMMLHTPDYYHRLLCDLWVDKISHAGHWRLFILNLTSEWKSTALWTLIFMVSATIIFSTTLFATHNTVNSIVQTTSMTSISMSLTSLAASLFLVRRHQGQVDSSAPELGDYLETVYNERFGFQPLAMVFALPYATCIWSLIFLILSVLATSLQLNSWWSTIVVWSMIALLCGAIYLAVGALHVGEELKYDGERSPIYQMLVNGRSLLHGGYLYIKRQMHRLHIPRGVTRRRRRGVVESLA